MFRCLSPGAIGVNPADLDIYAAAKAANFQGLDPDLGKLFGGESPLTMLDKYKEKGLQVGAWGLPVPLYASDEEFRKGYETFQPVAAIAASVGAYRCATWIMPYSETRPYDENFAFHVERLKLCAELLERNNCRLGLEFIGPKTFREGKGHAFIHDLKGMLDLAKAVGPNVGLLLDSYHWYTSHGMLEELAALSDDDIVLVHINDAPKGIEVDQQQDQIRAIPGETGVIDLVGFLRTLDKIGYTGPVTPEPFSAKLKEVAPQRAVKLVGDAFEHVWVKALGIR